MAHTFSRTILTHASSAGNPISIGSVTVNAGETVLCLMLVVQSGTNRAGGSPTLSGAGPAGPYTFVQRNSVQKAAASPEASCELWDILNPIPGTYTLTIPNTGALTVFYALASGAAAAGGKSEFDAANGGNNTSTNPTPGATVLSEPGNITFAVCATGAQTWAPSAQAGTIINNNDDGATGSGRQYLLSAARGSQTLSWTFGTSDDWGAVAASYKEVPPHALNNYLRVIGAGMRAGSG